MFKKLKDKIAEEVKQSPARWEQILNTAQVKKSHRKLSEILWEKRKGEREREKKNQIIIKLQRFIVYSTHRTFLSV